MAGGTGCVIIRVKRDAGVGNRHDGGDRNLAETFDLDIPEGDFAQNGKAEIVRTGTKFMKGIPRAQSFHRIDPFFIYFLQGDYIRRFFFD